MRALWTVVLVGCVSEPQKPGLIAPPDDPVVETDHEDTDHPVTAYTPPLCEVQASPPPVAADLAAWAAAVRASDDRYQGRWNFDSLLAAGDATDLPVDERALILVERGFHKLRFFDIDGAIVDLTEAEKIVSPYGGPARSLARKHLATAWLRKAELDNCIATGDAHACLVPFSDEALHLREEGMTHVIEVLERFLTEDHPDALAQAWLLNVAHMALDTWPEAVQADWLYDPAALEPEAPFPTWTNVAREAGITGVAVAGTASLNDWDGDGFTDMLISATDPEAPMRLYLSRGDGTFCDASHASGVSAIRGVLGFSAADYDNDGDLDAAVPHGAWNSINGLIRMSLLRNDGTGRFTDVAIEAGVASPVGPSQIGLWGDVDNDGWVDLFVGREHISLEGERDAAPASLYMNQGNGTFVDVAPALGIDDPGSIKGASFGDLDNDGDLDLYLAVFHKENKLLINDGSGRFREGAREAGVLRSIDSFSTWFWDFNQDGMLDIFVASYPDNAVGQGPLDDDWGDAAEGWVRDSLGLGQLGETAVLYVNRGPEGFVNVSEAVGLDDIHATMGAGFGDFDNDGFPDLYLGTGASAFDAIEPNTAYHNVGGTQFFDVTTAMGTGHLQKGHGVSFGDIDEDGDEDLLADMGGAYPADAFMDALFANPNNPEHGVILRLEGVTCNRSAIGARVRVVTSMGVRHSMISQGGSFGGNTLQVEAGFRPAEELVRVEIDWPGGETEVVDELPVDHVVMLRQGEGVVGFRPMARMPMGGDAVPHGHP